MLARYVADSMLLNQPAESLADFVGTHLNAVIMGRAGPLFEFLQLTSGIRCGLQMFGEFGFELLLFRVHAMFPEIHWSTSSGPA